MLSCDVCGKDVGKSYRTNKGTGWLAWWEREKGGEREVHAIRVCCHGEDGENRCLNKLERRLGEDQSDGHLDWFTGRWALPQMWRLLRDYQWTEDARERLLDVFTELSRLPAGDGPPNLG